MTVLFQPMNASQWEQFLQSAEYTTLGLKQRLTTAGIGAITKRIATQKNHYNDARTFQVVDYDKENPNKPFTLRLLRNNTPAVGHEQLQAVVVFELPRFLLELASNDEVNIPAIEKKTFVWEFYQYLQKKYHLEQKLLKFVMVEGETAVPSGITEVEAHERSSPLVSLLASCQSLEALRARSNQPVGGARGPLVAWSQGPAVGTHAMVPRGFAPTAAFNPYWMQFPNAGTQPLQPNAFQPNNVAQYSMSPQAFSTLPFLGSQPTLPTQHLLPQQAGSQQPTREQTIGELPAATLYNLTNRLVNAVGTLTAGQQRTEQQMERIEQQQDHLVSGQAEQHQELNRFSSLLAKQPMSVPPSIDCDSGSDAGGSHSDGDSNKDIAGDPKNITLQELFGWKHEEDAFGVAIEVKPSESISTRVLRCKEGLVVHLAHPNYALLCVGKDQWEMVHKLHIVSIRFVRQSSGKILVQHIVKSTKKVLDSGELICVKKNGYNLRVGATDGNVAHLYDPTKPHPLEGFSNDGSMVCIRSKLGNGKTVNHMYSFWEPAESQTLLELMKSSLMALPDSN